MWRFCTGIVLAANLAEKDVDARELAKGVSTSNMSTQSTLSDGA